jgi:hypothetical protein
LGEGRHNNEQSYAFRLELIRDPRFPTVVNDIVVESGSSKHQGVMDRFIHGDSVPDTLLRRAWQDTTQADSTWDLPMYEEFFRAVRAINASLPRDRQLRVLLGDPPFDWESATRDDTIRISLQRDPFAADLIQREVLSKHRRALVIYGDMHFLRRPPMGASSLITRLGAITQPRIFTIWTHTAGSDLQALQSDINTWPKPALALIKGTSLGIAPFSFYRGGVGDDSRMEDQFDAVLYVGPVASVTVRRGDIAPSLCADADYMQMRLSRMRLMDPPGAVLPPGVVNPADRLRQYCASVTKDQ